MIAKTILASVLTISAFIGVVPVARADSPAAVAGRFVGAWNSHSARDFASLFTEDAYWVPVVDIRLDGRKEIVADLEKAHETWARHTTMKASDLAVRNVSPDVALVLFHAGFLDASGIATAPGNALILVVVRQGKQWSIAAGQLTKPGSTVLPQ